MPYENRGKKRNANEANVTNEANKTVFFCSTAGEFVKEEQEKDCSPGFLVVWEIASGLDTPLSPSLRSGDLRRGASTFATTRSGESRPPPNLPQGHASRSPIFRAKKWGRRI